MVEKEMNSNTAGFDATSKDPRYEVSDSVANFRRTIPVVAWALVLSSLLLGAVYPGFMSFDSIHTLREARESVSGGAYPPMASYLWRIVEYFAEGPAPMLLVQNTVVLGSVGVFLVLCGYGAIASCIVLALLMFLPVVVGPMLVVWKDVAMTAAFAFATTIILAEHVRNSKPRLVRLGGAFVAIVIGMALRVNALPAAIPLVLWAVWIAERDARSKSLPVVVAFRGALLMALALFAVFVINTYRLPDFGRLDPNTSIRSMQIYDLIGISAKSDAPFVEGFDRHDPEALGRLAARIYDPRHLNLTLGSDQDGVFENILHSSVSSAKLTDSWLATIMNNPWAYLEHRAAVSSELIGATKRSVYYPTHPEIDPNEFGYVHVPSLQSDCVVGYVLRQCGSSDSDGLICRVWLVLVVALGLSVLALRGRQAPGHRWPLFAITGSGLGYLVPLFVVSPASDLRYSHWAVVAFVLAALMAARMVFLRRRVGSG